MIIGITGASGFIGRHVIARLRKRGDECVAFSRSAGTPVEGCRETRALSPEAAPDLRGIDAVVNLAGESIIGLWTAAKRRRILESRVRLTRQVVQACRREDAPKVLVNASAIGFYGDRGEEELAESSTPGADFLAEVTQQWEAAAREAEDGGVRVARVRIGFVLGPDGGAWPLLRRVFRLGLGGRLGDGRQWMSLVHIADVAGLIAFLLDDAKASGAFNAVGTEPVRNADFTARVAKALHRPAFLPAPALALRGALGEMSQLLLMSERVLPRETLLTGYRHEYPTVDRMLENV